MWGCTSPEMQMGMGQVHWFGEWSRSVLGRKHPQAGVLRWQAETVEAIGVGGTAGSLAGIDSAQRCKGMGLDLLGTGSPPGLSSFSAPAPLPHMMDSQRKEGKKNPTLKPAACDSSLLYLHLL